MQNSIETRPRGPAAFALPGKVAIVTGASVVTCARSVDEAQAVAAAICEGGGRAVGVPADVTERRSCAELVERAVKEFGRLDVLVNNAGIEIVRAADECGQEQWQRTLDTNLVGCFHCSQLAAARMREQGRGGSIINVSSMASVVAMPGLAAYGASKAAVNQLTRALAAEWAASGIRVNAIAPGFMDNRMRDGGMTPLERVRAVTPLGRRGRPEELVGRWSSWPPMPPRMSPARSCSWTAAGPRSDELCTACTAPGRPSR